MTAVHASVMVRNRIQIVIMLIVRSIVLFRASDVWQHVHVWEREVHVDGFLPECWVHVGISVEPLEMNDEHGGKFRDVEFFYRFAGFLAVRTLPATHNLTVEVHVETLCYMALVDVVWRQLQTEIREGFVGCAFVSTDCALYGAFDLAVEQAEDKAFAGFCVL